MQIEMRDNVIIVTISIPCGLTMENIIGGNVECAEK